VGGDAIEATLVGSRHMYRPGGSERHPQAPKWRGTGVGRNCSGASGENSGEHVLRPGYRRATQPVHPTSHRDQPTVLHQPADMGQRGAGLQQLLEGDEAVLTGRDEPDSRQIHSMILPVVLGY
jgi:hypothetical protein